MFLDVQKSFWTSAEYFVMIRSSFPAEARSQRKEQRLHCNRRSVWIAPQKMDSRRTVGRTVVGTRSDGRRPFYSSIRALYTPFKARSGRSGFGNPAVAFRSESKSEMKC